MNEKQQQKKHRHTTQCGLKQTQCHWNSLDSNADRESQFWVLKEFNTLKVLKHYLYLCNVTLAYLHIYLESVTCTPYTEWQ